MARSENTTRPASLPRLKGLAQCSLIDIVLCYIFHDPRFWGLPNSGPNQEIYLRNATPGEIEACLHWCLAELEAYKDAKTHLSKLLRRVMNGEQIIIAKTGKPIAVLSPIAETTVRRIPGIVSLRFPANRCWHQ